MKTKVNDTKNFESSFILKAHIKDEIQVPHAENIKLHDKKFVPVHALKDHKD
jgi:hypothetical protein